jgi:zona occludens toxin
MPITSYTGLPGNGKTTLAVEDMMKNAKVAARPLWAAGFDGLQPGLASILKDPREWNAVKPGEICTCHDTENSDACDAHVIPNGSLIYVDEAWKWFGHLHDATRQATPGHVLKLAEHRHRGIDFVWTFQQPNQIYPFARGLMADHYHVVRRFGTKLIDVYKWAELNEDVKSTAKRENAQKTTRMLPSEAWANYKSAEIHTIKAKIPWKVLALPLFILLAGVSAYFAYQELRPPTAAEIAAKSAPLEEDGAVVGVTTKAGAAPEDRGPRWASAFDYAKEHLPRLATMPWTAPVFDDRDVTADPELYCMSSREGEVADGEFKGFSCTCYTEQATLYEISEPECRTIARRGPVYNPYRQKREDAEVREPTVQQAVPAVPAVQAVSAAMVTGQMTKGYGGIGIKPDPGQ